jgi:hypothetical protein
MPKACSRLSGSAYAGERHTQQSINLRPRPACAARKQPGPSPLEMVRKRVTSLGQPPGLSPAGKIPARRAVMPKPRTLTSARRPGTQVEGDIVASALHQHQSPRDPYGPEAWRHLLFPPSGAERRGPYRYNLGMRRSPPHAPRLDRQPPVPGHPRPGESRRTLIAGSRVARIR